MANTTTNSSLPLAVQQSLALTMLSVPTPNFIYNIPAMQDVMPRNGGNIKRYRRFNPLAAALVPLGDSGEEPPPQDLTAIDIDARIDWYGTYIRVNEQVVLQHQESVLNQAAIRLGVSLRLTEDTLLRDMLQSSASSINAVYGTNGDVPTNLTASDISVMVRNLLSANGYMFLSGVQGEDRFGTAPVRQAYLGLMHTDLTKDLETVDDFIPAWNYPNQQDVMDGEWGAVRNSRFFVSSNGTLIPNSSQNFGANVYAITFAAKESYACIKQDGASAQFIYRPAVYSDALAQNVTIGYKFANANRILNDQWVGNLLVTLNS